MKVLVVDDDVVVRMVLSIEWPDVEVFEAIDVLDGYEIAQAELPDVVIVDRKLPNGDGLELVRKLRQTFATSRTPILVMTSGHDEAHRAEVTRAGADDYLAKPFEPAELMARLDAIRQIDPVARRARRARTLSAIRLGRDPEPVPDPKPAAEEPTAGRWRRRRKG